MQITFRFCCVLCANSSIPIIQLYRYLKCFLFGRNNTKDIPSQMFAHRDHIEIQIINCFFLHHTSHFEKPQIRMCHPTKTFLSHSNPLHLMVFGARQYNSLMHSLLQVHLPQLNSSIQQIHCPNLCDSASLFNVTRSLYHFGKDERNNPIM